jgi:hypothetical protein
MAIRADSATLITAALDLPLSASFTLLMLMIVAADIEEANLQQQELASGVHRQTSRPQKMEWYACSKDLRSHTGLQEASFGSMAFGDHLHFVCRTQDHRRHSRISK